MQSAVEEAKNQGIPTLVSLGSCKGEEKEKGKGKREINEQIS